MLSTLVSDRIADIINAQLLFLDNRAPGKDIGMYINCPGGIISAGLAIYDTMQLIRSDISTVCVGQAVGMGIVLLCAGARGKRYALPNVNISFHQAIDGAQGYSVDVEITAGEIMRVKDIMAKHTGQPLEKIIHDTDRGVHLNPEQAVEYGIIDEVVGKTANQNASS